MGCVIQTATPGNQSQRRLSQHYHFPRDGIQQQKPEEVIQEVVICLDEPLLLCVMYIYADGRQHQQ